MKASITCILFCFCIAKVTGQVTDPPLTATEQQIEQIVEQSEDAETTDDYLLVRLAGFLKDPVNLNVADEQLLQELQVLNSLQISHLLRYRDVMGRLIDIHELQAIPGWDVQTIRQILPYISITSRPAVAGTLLSRLRMGSHAFLLRASRVIEKSDGFLQKADTVGPMYQGSPDKLFFRYRYSFKQLLQFGVVGEKDAGEAFFKKSQTYGFDFYSAHLFIRDIGKVRSLALGDFTVNLGQGLMQWQSMSFRKGADLTSMKRQSASLRPYHSAGEFNFHRGIGVVIGSGRWEAMFFASFRKIDANVQQKDSADPSTGIVSSIQTSGLHRTKAELADRNILRQFSWGGRLSCHVGKWRIAFNSLQTAMNRPLIKAAEPYNQFVFSGQKLSNFSADYHYTYRNVHLFGEAAISANHKMAMVQGLLLSLSEKADMGLLIRSFSRGYQSLSGSAFSEGSQPVNEKGIYTGISIRPAYGWQFDFYADFYRFPWLRFRVNAPDNGQDYFIQATYKPNRQTELISRYRTEIKGGNMSDAQMVIQSPVPVRRKQWRIQANTRLNHNWLIHNRIDMVWVKQHTQQTSNGFLIYVDAVYKPKMKPLSVGGRIQFFRTDDYDSRMYAYENDVLYSFSIPVFSEKGFRYYININYNINKKCEVWLRWAQTAYPGQTSVGSGSDRISGPVKSECRVQVLYEF